MVFRAVMEFATTAGVHRSIVDDDEVQLAPAELADQDVGQIEIQADPDPGRMPGKGRQRLGQKNVAGKNPPADMHLAGADPLDLRQLPLHVVGQGQDVRRLLHEREPGIGGKGPLPPALEQPDANAPFHRPDAARQRGLTDVKRLCRFCETALVRSRPRPRPDAERVFRFRPAHHE